MPIFLDHHSTTPVDEAVFVAMRPWFAQDYGNPHSLDHAFGWRAEAAVEAARAQVASLIGACPGEIVFTSGATESNNLALQGLAANLEPGRRHVIITATAHPCVAGVADWLEMRGHSITRLFPARDGRYSPQLVADALRPDTGLVSIEAAHHEFGTIQPIAEIAALTRAHDIAFHTDAAQAAARVTLDVGDAIDLMSLSAHKMHGPKGIGALYVRRREGLKLTPLFAGGGQQRGLRPGTIATPLAVGFGVAAAIGAERLADDAARVGGLRDRLLAGLSAGIPGLAVNGSLAHRLPQNLNLRLPGVLAADLLYTLRDTIAISAGSACASAVIEPSPSLMALGLTSSQALSSIRIGLGRTNTTDEIDIAIAAIVEACNRVKSASTVA